MQNWNKSFIILLVITVAGTLYLLAPILTPFLTGALLAYLVNPLVLQLMRIRVPRLLSVILVFIALFLAIVLLIVLLIPVIQNQITNLIEVLPNMLAWLQNSLLPSVTHYFGIQEIINISLVKTTLATQLSKAGPMASKVINTVVYSSLLIVNWFINLILIPVVTFYLLRDWSQVIKAIHDLLPRSIAPTVTHLAKQCDSVLSAFFRGQLMVMLALGVIYSIGLSLIGLKIGVILGLIMGLISIVPYLGGIVGIITASIAALVQFGSFNYVLLVWLVFIIGQVAESMFLTPNLVGDRIGLHPVAVIFAVLAGGSLFGFFGVLLALPAAAVIMVWLRFLNQHYRKSRLYK